MSRFPCRKPDWVRESIAEWHRLHAHLSHRKLAALFNQLYFATTGMSVGRTWVREFLKRQAYEALHARRELKHGVPPMMPANRIWGVDTTSILDQTGNAAIALAILDHGSRLNIALRRLRRFNRYSLAGALLLAFGEFGVPHAIKLDNHPVHHAGGFKCLMRYLGVRLRFTRPASPWQNGRIERLIGTLKSCLAGYAVQSAVHLDDALAQFRVWYNCARPHQHLNGCTPQQVWRGVDPYVLPPKSAETFSAWGGRLLGMVLRH